MAGHMQGNNMVYLLPKPTPDHTITQIQAPTMYADPNSAIYSAPAKFCGTPQTKAPKRLQKNDSTQQRTRCKRRLDFARLGLPAQTQSPVVAARRNERERNRVKHINDTFTVLRDHLPSDYNTAQSKINKEMSKVEILRAAIDYITSLEEMLEGKLQISSGVDLKALIQASTSPERKSPEIDKDAIRKLIQYHKQQGNHSSVSSPASIPSVDSPAPVFDCDTKPIPQLTSLDGVKQEYHQTTCYKNDAIQNLIGSDLNANEVKSSDIPGFLDSLPTQSNHVQYNQISQSHQYDTLTLENSLLSNHGQFQNKVQTHGASIQGHEIAPVSNNTTNYMPQNNKPQVYDADQQLKSQGFSLDPNIALFSGNGCSDSESLFSSLDIAEVDFTSLLMGCD